MSEDFIKDVFDEGIKLFVSRLLVAETQCENAIEYLDTVTDKDSYQKIRRFHEERLSMIRTLRLGMRKCTLPTIDQWLEIFDGGIVPLDRIGLTADQINRVLQDLEKEDG